MGNMFSLPVMGIFRGSLSSEQTHMMFLETQISTGWCRGKRTLLTEKNRTENLWRARKNKDFFFITLYQKATNTKHAPQRSNMADTELKTGVAPPISLPPRLRRRVDVGDGGAGRLDGEDLHWVWVPLNSNWGARWTVHCMWTNGLQFFQWSVEHSLIRFASFNV